MDWISQHTVEIIALALIAGGVWWLMPRAARLPKPIGLLLAICGAGLLASRLHGGAGPKADMVLFFTFSAVAILSAILMITDRNPVYSALWFALATLSVCGLFLLQYAAFLAAATVIVYAGAIVVTFLFVIMLAQQSGATIYDQRARQPLVATVFAILLLAALLGTLQTSSAMDFQFANRQMAAAASVEPNPLSRPPADQYGTILALGRSLFGDYLLAVELAGTLLLVATIGAIAIAPKRRGGTR
ncbi:MAG TPA: NADH-quinone oxidoreductase subunit J [Lacipirellulaceae bacterium]|nr:NADH-quinone oxidoreductase subunit J [Lacipirellulaceae bacterium]